MSNLRVEAGRLSYPSLVTADELSGKWQTDYIFEAGSLPELEAAVDKAIQEQWGDNPPASVANPIKNGDDRNSDPGGVYKGKMYFKASTKLQAPNLYEMDGGDLIRLEQSRVQDVVFGGQNASLNVTVKAYDMPTNKGVSIYLNAVRIDGGGEKFGGDGASSDFGPVSNSAF